jgi:hypothetical protein
MCSPRANSLSIHDLIRSARWCRLLLVALLSLSSANEIWAVESGSITMPNGREIERVDFHRHVVPLLGRFGCNAAACHGSFQGRGGMQLSLFGYSPQMDFNALSARIDVENPAESLALQKPTATLEHGGGIRFEQGSWPYRIFEQWIKQGGEAEASPELVRLSVDPPELVLSAADPPAQLRVYAAFSGDLPPENVTPLCRFMSGDPGVVTVDDSGRVAAARSGASHIVVEYLGRFAMVMTTMPYAGDHWSHNPLEHVANTIDFHINQRLKQLNLDVSPPADDYTFLRRASLDIVGRLPTIDEIRQFTSSTKPLRREELIDCLLQDDRHASLWATRFCDITRCTADLMEGPDDLKAKRAKMWHDWFRARLQRNAPYHEIVRGFLCGTSVGEHDVEAWIDSEAGLIRAAKNGFETDYAGREFCDLFWRRVSRDGLYPFQELAEITAAGLLGSRIQCARCHKHPYDTWTQTDYRSFVNLFAGVQFGSSTELNRAVLNRLEERRSHGAREEPNERLPRLQQIYFDPASARPLRDLRTGQPLPPRPLGGPEFESTSDPRDQFMSWLVANGQRQFAAAFVNRVWAHYFGRGLVEPVDGFSAINPPSHPQLLDALAEELIASGYDIRRLERTILISDVYQRSSQSVGNNAMDERHYARSYVRPLLAEVALDVVHQAVGAPLLLGSDAPTSAAAIELAIDRPSDQRTADMLRTFGRAERRSNCDCDRQLDPSLRQTLFLMSDEALVKSIHEGRLVRELTRASPPAGAVETMFLTMLSRKPNPDELHSALQHIAANDSDEAWPDLVWALVNTREFLTNH